jgi:hypothetical protein
MPDQTPNQPQPTDAPKKDRTCAVCGESEATVTPGGDHPATDKVGVHNFVADEGRTPREREPDQPQS